MLTVLECLATCVKTPKSLSKADIPHTGAMELIDQASKSTLQRFMEDHVTQTIRERDEYAKEKIRAIKKGETLVDMTREVENINILEAWTGDIWRAFVTWSEKNGKDYATFIDNPKKFAIELGKQKEKWGIANKKKKVPGTRLNDTWWTINIKEFCEKVGMEVEDADIKDLIAEEEKVEESEKRREEELKKMEAKKGGNKTLESFAENEEWEDGTRAPLLYDDQIPDLWLEVNTFVSSLYIVNRAVRRWWLSRKVREDNIEEGDAVLPDKDVSAFNEEQRRLLDQTVMQDLSSCTNEEETELPEQEFARKQMLELKKKTENKCQPKRCSIPPSFEEHLRAKGLRPDVKSDEPCHISSQ